MSSYSTMGEGERKKQCERKRRNKTYVKVHTSERKGEKSQLPRRGALLPVVSGRSVASLCRCQRRKARAAEANRKVGTGPTERCLGQPATSALGRGQGQGQAGLAWDIIG